MTGEQQIPQSLPENEDLQRVTLESYLFSILTMAQCIEAACPAVGVQYSDQLVRIRRRLAFGDHNEASLEEARQALENTLAAYADQAYRYCEQQTQDLHAIMQALGDIEQLAADGPAEIAPRVAEIRKRLLSGREVASADPLTGLANRRELERQIKLRLAAEKQFCVLFFDIDDFGLLNETLGRETGDAILKQLADRLNPQIRARDLAARWLADEFIVILECDVDNARKRAEQLSRSLRGPYAVVEEGHEAKLEVGISAAVAECGPGDTPRQIWLRLEEDFHRRHDAIVMAESRVVCSATPGFLVS